MTTKYKAVALCRVSSLEQLLNNSLDTQKDNVLKAAEYLNVEIAKDGVWSGHVSSKKGVNFNRKDLIAIYDYCKRHKDVKYVIVQEVDRFMRSPDEQTYWYVKFWYGLGVRVWFADKPELNDDTHNASLFRFLEGWRAGGSNEERIKKSIEGGAKGLEHGRFPFAIKPGYIRGRTKAVPDIHPVKGPALKRVLISIAEHGITPTQALKDLNESEFMADGQKPYKMDKFPKIATDPFYAGIVEINKQIQVRNEYGLHEPLITIEQHKKIVEIFNGRVKNQTGPNPKGNPKYPLANLVTCVPCIGKKDCRFAGLDNKNSSGRVYEKYRCRSCKRYISQDELHDKVRAHLATYILDAPAQASLTQSLLDVWKSEEKQIAQDIARMRSRINEVELSIKADVKAATDPSNAEIKAEILQGIKEEKAEIAKLDKKIQEYEDLAANDKEDFLSFAVGFVSNVGDTFTDTSGKMDRPTRYMCKQLLIPSGFYLTAENKVYTTEISPIYRLEPNKKDPSIVEKSSMVRVKRL